MLINKRNYSQVTLNFSCFQAITPAGSYFLCGSFTAVAVLYVGMFVPETKGKTQEEMKDYFMGKTRENRKGLA